MKSGQTEHSHIIAINVRQGLPDNDRFVQQARVILGGDSIEDGWKRKVFAVDAKHNESIEPFVIEGILARKGHPSS